METTTIQNWPEYLVGLLVAALMWVVRGYASDVKHIKATYMTRQEIMEALGKQQEHTQELIEAHAKSTADSFNRLQASVDLRHTENTANFRELRIRFDTLNDTLLQRAMK